MVGGRVVHSSSHGFEPAAGDPDVLGARAAAFAMASDDHRSTYAYTRRPNRSFARAPFREILSQPAERSNRDAAVYPDHNAKDQ
jgi:hypothetical protein